MRDLLDHLGTSEVVMIATATAAGREITTAVGAVVVGDSGYIRSQNGGKGRWYQRVIQTPNGFVIDGTARYPVVFQRVADAEAVRQVDEATYRKYGGIVRSLLLRPLLWRTRDFVVKITADEGPGG